MNNNILVIILASGVFYGTPIFFAALGELFTERSGVLNLGVEGMMLMGGVSAVWASQHIPGSSWFVVLCSILIGAFAGSLVAALHAFLCITLRTNQTVAGLSITIFAGGLVQLLCKCVGCRIRDRQTPHSHFEPRRIVRCTNRWPHHFSPNNPHLLVMGIVRIVIDLSIPYSYRS
jgi:ABC-type uncharacterized transport system permease subunit